MKLLALTGAFALTAPTSIATMQTIGPVIHQQVNQQNDLASRLIKPDSWESLFHNIAEIYSSEHKKVRIDKSRLAKSIENFGEIYKHFIDGAVGNLVETNSKIVTTKEKFIRDFTQRENNEDDCEVYFGEHVYSESITETETWSMFTEIGVTSRSFWRINFCFLASVGNEIEISFKETIGFEKSTSTTRTITHRVNGREKGLKIQPESSGLSVISLYQKTTSRIHNVRYKVHVNGGQMATIYFNTARDNYQSVHAAKVDIGAYLVKMSQLRPDFFGEESGDMLVWNRKTNTIYLALPVKYESTGSGTVHNYKGDLPIWG